VENDTSTNITWNSVATLIRDQICTILHYDCNVKILKIYDIVLENIIENIIWKESKVMHIHYSICN